MSGELLHRLNALQARVDQLERARQLMWIRIRRAFVVAGVVIASMGGAAWAATGDCPNGLPFCFAANAPAMAAEVNQNFAQLKEWIEQKAGPTGTSNITNTTQITSPLISGTTVSGQTVAGDTVTANISMSTPAISVSGDVSAPQNQWGGATQGSIFNRNDCNAHPTGYTCPQGQYVCAIHTDHTCGQNWYEASWWVDCCRI
jgi:hypothetical protein